LSVNIKRGLVRYSVFESAVIEKRKLVTFGPNKLMCYIPTLSVILGRNVLNCSLPYHTYHISLDNNMNLEFQPRDKGDINRHVNANENHSAALPLLLETPTM